MENEKNIERVYLFKSNTDKNPVWMVSFVSDGKKYNAELTREDSRNFFISAKGKTKAEVDELKLSLAEKYFDTATASEVSVSSSQKINSVDKVMQEFADKMIKAVEEASGNWKKPWFPVGMGWPRNKNGREYNGVNAILLFFACQDQKYKDSVFMTHSMLSEYNYKKVKEEGKEKHVPMTDKEGNTLPPVRIKKGEHGYPVIHTSFLIRDRETGDKISLDDFNKLSIEEKEKYSVKRFTNNFTVFNIDQTNLQEVRPEEYKRLTANAERKNHLTNDFSHPAMDKMFSSNLWICPISFGSNEACYYPQQNRIELPSKDMFSEGESYYGTALHEMAHSTGGKNLFDRLKSTVFGDDDYAEEELVAEFSAALVCQYYGMEKNMKEDSCNYIKTWLNKKKEKPSHLLTTLNQASKVFSFTTQRIDAIEKEMNKGILADYSKIRKENDNLMDRWEKIKIQENPSETSSVDNNERVAALVSNMRSNIIELPSAVLYVSYDTEKNELFAGQATNAGVFKEFVIDYDHDKTLDVNLNDLYTVIEESGKYQEQEEMIEEESEEVKFSRGI